MFGMNHDRILTVDGVSCGCGWTSPAQDGERNSVHDEHLGHINWVEAPIMTQLAETIWFHMRCMHLEFNDFVERTRWSRRKCQEFLSGDYDPNLVEVAEAGCALGVRLRFEIMDKTGAKVTGIKADDEDLMVTDVDGDDAAP